MLGAVYAREIPKRFSAERSTGYLTVLPGMVLNYVSIRPFPCSFLALLAAVLAGFIIIVETAHAGILVLDQS